MTDDDLLREASDPTTTGERLMALIRECQQRGYVKPSLVDAINSNPSLPLPYLAKLLRSGVLRAWYNPAVPALLMSEPRPEYAEAAHRLLVRSGLTTDATLSFESLIAAWGTRARLVARGQRARGIDAGAAVSLARHLAGLFGLPWPEG